MPTTLATATNRRQFFKRLAVVGGSLLLPPVALTVGSCAGAAPASGSKRTGFMPAFGKLEEEGKLAERVERAFDRAYAKATAHAIIQLLPAVIWRTWIDPAR